MTRVDHVAAGLAGYRQALRFPTFRRLWLAAAVSRAGDAVYFVALPLFAYGSTGSPAAVAALVLVEGGALVAGGMAAQFVVDRVEPRRLLVGADLVRALAVVALAALPSLPTALVVAAILALGTAWFSPTSAALLPRLVDPPGLSGANALLWTAGVALQLAAAPLGGLLVVAASARIAFGLNAVSFIGSAALLAGLPRERALAPGTGPWRQLPEALRTVPRLPLLGPLLAMQGLAALAVGATSALLVVLAERGYGLNGAGYGVWLALVGMGSLMGPIVVPALLRLPLTSSVSGAYVVRGLGDIGLGVLSNSIVGGALLLVYGLNTSSGSVAYQTLVQRSVPAALRGRAFALLDATWQLARLVSIALGGVLAGVVGIRVVFAAGGGLLVIAGLLGIATLGRRGSPPGSTG